jgi:hypothetical protein
MSVKEWLDTDINLVPIMKALGIAGGIFIALYVIVGIADSKLGPPVAERISIIKRYCATNRGPGAPPQGALAPEQQSQIISGLTADQALRLYEVHLAHAGVQQAQRQLVSMANTEYSNKTACLAQALRSGKINQDEFDNGLVDAHKELVEELSNIIHGRAD